MTDLPRTERQIPQMQYAMATQILTPQPEMEMVPSHGSMMKDSEAHVPIIPPPPNKGSFQGAEMTTRFYRPHYVAPPQSLSDILQPLTQLDELKDEVKAEMEPPQRRNFYPGVNSALMQKLLHLKMLQDEIDANNRYRTHHPPWGNRRQHHHSEAWTLPRPKQHWNRMRSARKLDDFRHPNQIRHHAKHHPNPSHIGKKELKDDDFRPSAVDPTFHKK